MFVLVNDVEGDGLGGEMIDRLGGGDHADEIVGLDVVAGFGGFAVNGDELLVDQSLHGRAR